MISEFFCFIQLIYNHLQTNELSRSLFEIKKPEVTLILDNLPVHHSKPVKAWIEEHAEDCVAVGEIGLDYSFKDFQSEEMREKQKVVFYQQQRGFDQE